MYLPFCVTLALIGLDSVLGTVSSMTPCHGVFTATSTPKNFTSPGYPWQYTNYLRCSWIIQAADPERRVAIEVIDSVIEGNDQCSYDHVTAYDGSSTDKDELQKWCGEERPKLVSASNSMSVALWTDNSNVNKGFLIRYYEADVSTCGGTLIATETLSSLTSPNYPNVYSANATCVWKIIAENDNGRVSIESSDFHLEPQIDCSCDNLTIRDGSGTNSNLGVFCGTRYIALTSSNRHLILVFRTDSSNNFQGFTIRYKSVQYTANCGGQLKASNVYNTFTSPGYPLSYRNNMHCSWTISATNSNDLISINVIDSQTEHSSDCRYDSVTVFDSASSRILQKLCGSTKPKIVSPRNSVSIVFRSDSSNTYKGFKIEYHQISATSDSCNCHLYANNDDGLLMSPGYPNFYPNDVDCTWRITAMDDGKNVQVSVLFSNMQESFGCLYDYVKVLDGSSVYSTTIGTFCGQASPTYISSSSDILIHFHADDSSTYTGFKIAYKQVNQGKSAGCNAFTTQLTARSFGQYIESPNYPGNYQNNVNCTWHITAMDYAEKVQVRVLVSNIEVSTHCIYDYVRAFDGSSVSSRRMGTFCGFSKPIYTSTGSDMLIQFHTDSARAHRYTGFRLMYKQVNQGVPTGGYEETTQLIYHTGDCALTTELTATSFNKYIESPNYPHNYPNNVDCTWHITAMDYGEKVQVRVLVLNIEESSNCGFDYMMISDGSPSYSTNQGKFCGHMTHMYTSTGSNIFITFHTDDSYAYSGFRIMYKQVNQGVPTGGSEETTQSIYHSGGYEVTTELAASFDQYIESPNYPRNYPDNLDCKWRITSLTYGKRLQVSVVVSNIEESSDCSYDYVNVFDGPSTDSTKLGTFCGHLKPKYTSTGSYVLIHFHTDGSRSYTGFQITYKQVDKNVLTDNTQFSSNAGPIVGGIIGSIAFILLVACFMACRSRRRNNGASRRAPSNDTGRRNTVFILGEVTDSARPTPTVFAAAPPPYSVAISKEYQGNFSPPSYQLNPGVFPAQAQAEAHVQAQAEVQVQVQAQAQAQAQAQP